MLSAWLRVIRVRFLMASVIAVSAGLALGWWRHGTIDAADAVLTLAGVMALHASVDLFNDYWDYKRGIDSRTTRTKMSGGTGVLPEGLLEPSSVYRAGIAFMVIGSVIGGYFVFTDGIIIAAILGFAVLSIYFYSTRIVDSGLGELFVGIKGAMIVMGAYYIQSGDLAPEGAITGAAMGALSALVLFIASFPDHDADKSRGRRTLVIMLGRETASRLFWMFPVVFYGMVSAGAISGMLPYSSMICLAAVPLAAGPARGLRMHHSRVDALIPHMSRTLAFSRTAGALLVAGILIGIMPA